MMHNTKYKQESTFKQLRALRKFKKKTYCIFFNISAAFSYNTFFIDLLIYQYWMNNTQGKIKKWHGY